MRTAILAATLAAVGCGGSNVAGPSSDPVPVPAGAAAPRGPIVVNVAPDGPSDNEELRSALALIGGRFPDLVRFVRDGSGDRTIRLRLDPAAMYVPAGSSHASGAWAQPAACPCAAEGEIAYGSMHAANDRRIILHELGHLFGLLDRSDGEGLLGGRPPARWPNDRAGNAIQEWEEYSAREWAWIEAALKADADAAGR